MRKPRFRAIETRHKLLREAFEGYPPAAGLLDKLEAQGGLPIYILTIALFHWLERTPREQQAAAFLDHCEEQDRRRDLAALDELRAEFAELMALSFPDGEPQNPPAAA